MTATTAASQNNSNTELAPPPTGDTKETYEHFLKESFATPEDQQSYADKINAACEPVFKEAQQCKDAKVFVVTSGGTLVAVEKRAVRFVANFSTGGRGSKLTEYLLGDDPATSNNRVIFIARRSSLMPYARNFQYDASNLDELYENPEGAMAKFKKASELYAAARKSGRLTICHFDTVSEYLLALQISSQCCHRVSSSPSAAEGKKVETRTIFVCAAAVSDYYIPRSEMAENKISGVDPDGRLRMAFCPVPKTLGLLVSEWAPEAIHVTFKLETDPHDVILKARKNIKKYSLKFVVANQLQTYRHEARLFVACDTQEQVDEKVKNHGAEQITEGQAEGEKLIASFMMKGDVEKLLAEKLVALT